MIKANISVIPVFVSSTFADMSDERNILVGKTFRELSLRCRSAGLELWDIDLRWGITDDEVKAGALIEACLEAINRSLIFIGILGARYGTVLTTIPSRLIERWPWINDCVGRSITEIEITHGVLISHNSEREARIYYKSDANDGGDEKLSLLKTTIEAKGIVPRLYDDAEHLSRLMQADLWHLLRQFIEKRDALDSPGSRALYPPAIIQRSIIRHWDAPTISSSEVKRVISTSYREKSNLIAIYSDDRGERSSVFADLLRNRAFGGEFGHIIAHICSASPISSNLNVVINVLITELFDKTGVVFRPPGFAPSEEILIEQPTLYANKGHLKEKLLAAIAAARDQNVTFLIDGLDEIHRFESHQFPLVNKELPPEVRIIIGIGTLAARKQAERHGFRIVDISELPKNQVAPFVQTYLSRYSKKLDAIALSQIEQWPLATSIFALKILLKELRFIDGHDVLQRALQELTSCVHISDLINRVIDRIERVFGHLGSVRNVFASLLVTRRGVPEEYLARMFRPFQTEVDGESARGSWSALRSVLGEHLYQSLTDAYDLDPRMPFELVLRLGEHERQAVKSRLGLSRSEADAIHLELASELIGSTDPEKKCELVWHLWRAGRWERLERLLLTPSFLKDIWRLDQELCRTYWSDLEKHAGSKMTEKLVKILVTKGGGKLPSEIFDLLHSVGSRDLVAEVARIYSVDESSSREEPRNIFSSGYSCSVVSDSLSFSWGPFAHAGDIARRSVEHEAESNYLRQCLEAAEKTNNPVHIARATAALAGDIFVCGELEEASGRYEELEQLLRREAPTFAERVGVTALFDIAIECARGQRDCYTLQGQVDKARAKSAVLRELISLRDNVESG